MEIPASRDWDIIAKWDDICSFLGMNDREIASIKHVLPFEGKDDEPPRKLIARLNSGEVIEFETAEYCPSTDFLASAGNLQRIVIREENKKAKLPEVAMSDVMVVGWRGCLLFKLAQSFFPINWRKAVSDYAQISSVYSSARSITTLLNTLTPDFTQKDASQFLSKRLSENHDIFRASQRAERSVSLPLTPISKESFDRIKLTMFGSPEPKADWTVLPGLIFDWSRYKVPKVEAKRAAAILAIDFVALHLYVVNPTNEVSAMLKGTMIAYLPPKEFMHEIRLLAMESLCTATTAVGPRPHPDPCPVAHDELCHLYKRTKMRYSLHRPCSIPDSEEPVFDLSELYSLFTVASLYQPEFGSEYTPEKRKRSQLATYIPCNFEDLLKQPRNALWSALAVLRPADAIPSPPAIPVLPEDLIRAIFDNIDDHVTLSRVIRSCKQFYRIGKGYWWSLLAECVDEETIEEAKQNLKYQDRTKIEMVFPKCLDENKPEFQWCRHCGDKHKKVHEDEWRQRCWKGPEHEEYYCVCPSCDVGSWRTCSYRYDFFL
jgi:hypothetical protein